jgi:hypothetical protein
MASGSIIRRIDVDELPRHLSSLEQELGNDGAIELTRNDLVIAEVRAKVVPIPSQSAARRPIPDFEARLRELFPGGPLSTDSTELIREDRDGRG